MCAQADEHSVETGRQVQRDGRMGGALVDVERERSDGRWDALWSDKQVGAAGAEQRDAADRRALVNAQLANRPADPLERGARVQLLHKRGPVHRRVSRCRAHEQSGLGVRLREDAPRDAALRRELRWERRGARSIEVEQKPSSRHFEERSNCKRLIAIHL